MFVKNRPTRVDEIKIRIELKTVGKEYLQTKFCNVNVMKHILSLGRNKKDDNIIKLMANKDTCHTPRTPDSSQAPV